MSRDEAIHKAAVALAEKRAKGCRACLLKTEADPGAGWRDMHRAAHLKLARGDVNLVAPILWAAHRDGSISTKEG